MNCPVTNLKSGAGVSRDIPPLPPHESLAGT